MKGLFLVLLAFFILEGCSTFSVKKMNGLNVGMGEKEVVEILGPADMTSQKGSMKFFRYHGDGGGAVFFVKLVDGKVESYGLVGDFDSTKDPTLNVNLNKE